MSYKDEEEASWMIKVTKYLYEKQYDEPYVLHLKTLPQTFKSLVTNRNLNDKSVEYIFRDIKIEDVVGKLAFFPDIAMVRGSVEEAFGVILAGRNTNSWTGFRYFVKLPQDKSMSDLMNTAPIVFHDVDMPDFKEYFIGDEFDVACNFLNAYCSYEYQGEKYRAYIKNFDEKNIGIDLIKEDGYVLKEVQVPIEKRNELLLDINENIGNITFGLAISKNN